MPMDETQARVAVDLSGRPAMTFKGKFPTDHVGEFPAEMCVARALRPAFARSGTDIASTKGVI